MELTTLRQSISSSAFAFRGYNVTNLGKSGELLGVPAYERIIADHLSEAATACSDITGRKVDLIQRVKERRETTLESYDEAIALILAMSLAQLKILHEFFEVDYRDA